MKSRVRFCETTQNPGFYGSEKVQNDAKDSIKKREEGGERLINM